MELTRIEVIERGKDIVPLFERLKDQHLVIPLASSLGELIPSDIRPFDSEWHERSGVHGVVVLASSIDKDAYDRLKWYTRKPFSDALGSEGVLLPGIAVVYAGHRCGAYISLPDNVTAEGMHNAIVAISEVLSRSSVNDRARDAELVAATELIGAKLIRTTPLQFIRPFPVASRHANQGRVTGWLDRERKKRGPMYAIVVAGLGLIIALLSFLFGSLF
jgi:hypothetical protein